MIGKYQLTQEEIEKYVPWMLNCIEHFAMLNEEEWDDENNHISFNSTGLNPCNVNNILTRHLGWKRVGGDHNGWDNYTWSWYKHPNYKFYLCVFYTGYNFNMEIYPTNDYWDDK